MTSKRRSMMPPAGGPIDPGDDDLHTRAERLLDEAVGDELGASTLTLAEVLLAPAREGRMTAAEEAFGALELQELLSPPGTASRLARLRVDIGLRMPDCCVLLAAEHLGAGVASFGHRLVRAASNRGLLVRGD